MHTGVSAFVFSKHNDKAYGYGVKTPEKKLAEMNFLPITNDEKRLVIKLVLCTVLFVCEP